MELPSPYLKAERLADVIAALQFLGQCDKYKLTVDDWNKRLATPPKSTQQNSWAQIFDEHPEFFRKNEDELVSLVWRRAISKNEDDLWPSLQPETIAGLIDTAIRLHTMAVDARRTDENRETERKLARRWWIQLAVSVITAILAFVGVVLAAVIRTGTN